MAATLAFVLAGGGTAFASKTTTPKTIAWGNVVVAEGAHPVKIARIGPFHITAECTSGGTGRYFIKSQVAIVAYGEDSGAFTLAPRTPHYITDDVDYDEAFYAWAPSTGASIQGTTFNFTPTYTGASNCVFQGQIIQTS